MTEGIVKSWISDRRCGFIVSKDVRKDILVKSSNLDDAIYLEEGEKVQFNIKNTQRGPIAINVVSLNS